MEYMLNSIAAVGVVALLLLSLPADAQPAIPPGPGPANPAMVQILTSGLNTLCSNFLSHPKMSPENLQALAKRAGYEAGADDTYGAVGQPIPNAPAAISFHAATGPGADAPSVTIHLTPSPVTCQLRVNHDAAAWSAFLSTMPARGGSLVAAAEITPDTKDSHEVYAGGITGLPKGYTSFVNRWVGSDDPAKCVYTSINVLPDTGAGD
jgi:hypothetical protein